MFEALMLAVGDRAVGEQGGKNLVQGLDDLVQPADVEDRFLLARERGVRQIFRRGGRPDATSRLSVPFWSNSAASSS